MWSQYIKQYRYLIVGVVLVVLSFMFGTKFQAFPENFEWNPLKLETLKVSVQGQGGIVHSFHKISTKLIIERLYTVGKKKRNKLKLRHFN